MSDAGDGFAADRRRDIASMGESEELPPRTDCVADNLSGLSPNDDLLAVVTFEGQCESREADPPYAEKVGTKSWDVSNVLPYMGVWSLPTLAWEGDGDGPNSFDREMACASYDDGVFTS